jgi:hypothetical protein
VSVLEIISLLAICRDFRIAAALYMAFDLGYACLYERSHARASSDRFCY